MDKSKMNDVEFVPSTTSSSVETRKKNISMNFQSRTASQNVWCCINEFFIFVQQWTERVSEVCVEFIVMYVRCSEQWKSMLTQNYDTKVAECTLVHCSMQLMLSIVRSIPDHITLTMHIK